MTSARKELILDTDGASFTLGIIGSIGCGAFAAILWWSLAHSTSPVRSGAALPGWQTYIALGLGILMICSKRHPAEPGAARFALVCLFVVLAFQATASLLHVPDGIVRLLSFCSRFLAAIFFSGMAVSLVAWTWRKLRSATVSSQ